MLFTPAGIASPRILLLGYSPPTTVRCRSVYGEDYEGIMRHVILLIEQGYEDVRNAEHLVWQYKLVLQYNEKTILLSHPLSIHRNVESSRRFKGAGSRPKWYHDNSSTDISSTTLRLQTFRLQIFRLL